MKRLAPLFIVLLLLSFCNAGDYQAESIALFDRMTTAGATPDADQKWAIDSEIRSLKMTNNWDRHDALWFFANFDQAVAPLNWIKDDHNCTEVNSPTWTVNEGYTGNGTTMYLDTNYNPANDAVNYASSNASLIIYSRTNIDGSYYDMGGFDIGRSYFYSYASGTTRGWINSSATGGAAASGITNSLGLYVMQRGPGELIEYFKNGNSLYSAVRTNGGIPNINFFIGCINANGTPTFFSPRQYAVGGLGSSLNADEQTNLFTCIEAWMDYWGTGVVAGTTEFPYPSLFSEEIEAANPHLKSTKKLKSLKPF